MTRSGAPRRFVPEPHVATIVVVPLDRMVGMVCNDQHVVRHEVRRLLAVCFRLPCLSLEIRERSGAYLYAYLRRAFSSDTSNSFVISTLFVVVIGFPSYAVR